MQKQMLNKIYIVAVLVGALTVPTVAHALGSEPGSNPQHIGPSAADSTANNATEAYNRGVYLFQIAQTQAQKGNRQGQKDLLKEAIENFEKALTLDPKLVAAQSNIGFAYLTLEKEKDAEKAFQQALAIDKNHLNTLNGLATTQALRGNNEAALTTFDKLTLLDPGNAEFFFNKGSVLQKAGRPKEAEAAYQEAIRLDANHQQSWFNLATLYENTERFQEAVKAYETTKHLDITTSIGLEATNRLQWLEKALKHRETQQASNPQPVGPSQ